VPSLETVDRIADHIGALTPQDAAVWARVCAKWWEVCKRRAIVGESPFAISILQDLRDGALMRQCMRDGYVEVIWADENGVFCEYANHRLPGRFRYGRAP
jgi:hypothetical protein